jgi:hypothetical protein
LASFITRPLRRWRHKRSLLLLALLRGADAAVAARLALLTHAAALRSRLCGRHRERPRHRRRLVGARAEVRNHKQESEDPGLQAADRQPTALRPYLIEHDRRAVYLMFGLAVGVFQVLGARIEGAQLAERPGVEGELQDRAAGMIRTDDVPCASMKRRSARASASGSREIGTIGMEALMIAAPRYAIWTAQTSPRR